MITSPVQLQRKTSITEFSRKLYHQNWNDIYNNTYNNTDAQCAFSILQRVIDQLIEDVFPVLQPHIVFAITVILFCNNIL